MDQLSRAAAPAAPLGSGRPAEPASEPATNGASTSALAADEAASRSVTARMIDSMPEPIDRCGVRVEILQHASQLRNRATDAVRE